MDIEEAANEILTKSISNAVCIDNDFLEPYSETDNYDLPAYAIPKKMYESFKQNSCLLDVYTYSNFEKWMEREESILKNRDLLILDWELTDGDPPFKDALAILSHAIFEDSLQFVYIYTQELDLMNVILHIHSYFHRYSQQVSKEKYSTLCEKIEDIVEIEDADNLLKGLSSISKDYCFDPEKRDELRRKIVEYLQNNIDSEDPRLIITQIDQILKTIIDTDDKLKIYQTIYLMTEQGFFKREGAPFDIKITPVEDEKYAFIINNTLLKISTKELDTTDETTENIVSSDQVYSDFSKTVWRRPRNFLALMGLEMKRLYRNGSTKIGKDLCEIDELAFFQHQRSLDELEAKSFNDFLKQLWMDEISSFLMDGKPIIFTVLKQYQEKIDIENQLSRADEDMLITNLAKLNHYYSIIRRKQRDRNIRFGDIFEIEEEEDVNEISCESESKDQKDDEKFPFLLCITPGCDCLRPDKINHEFFFISGKEIKLKKGLEKGETDYISFIIKNRKPTAIQWKTKPFTLCIPEEKNNIGNEITSPLSSKDITFRFICRQKEKYTQRIANQSFSEASRVGVSFAKY